MEKFQKIRYLSYMRRGIEWVFIHTGTNVNNILLIYPLQVAFGATSKPEMAHT